MPLANDAIGTGSRAQHVRARRFGPGPLLTLGAAGVVILLAWFAAEYGMLIATVAAVSAAWILCVLADWHLGIWGLIAFVPFIGLPEILTYPQTTLAVLVKDILFVTPCYISVGLMVLTRRLSITAHGLPWKLLLLFSCWTIAGLFNPGLITQLVGLIGVKVWLLYIPLAFIVPQFVDTTERLIRLLRLIVYTSAIPAAVGILEFLLVHAGHSTTVYSMYGFAAQAMFFSGGQFSLGDGSFISRIPSTFPGPAQFMYFLLAAVACCCALIAIERRRTRVVLAWIILCADCVALLTGGERGAFIYLPVLLALIALGTGGTQGLLRMLPTMAASLGLAVPLFAGAGAGLYALVSNLAIMYGQHLFTQDLAQALQTTLLGLGPGMDTQGAWRYSGHAGSLAWIENWWAKTIYELGLPGVALVGGIWLSIVCGGWTRSRAINDRRLRRVAACCVAYIMAMLLIAFKGTPLDTDPSNVYMWIVAGLLMRLPALAGPVPETAHQLSSNNAELRVVTGARMVL